MEGGAGGEVRPDELFTMTRSTPLMGLLVAMVLVARAAHRREGFQAPGHG